jgi:cation transport ATPase
MKDVSAIRPPVDPMDRESAISRERRREQDEKTTVWVFVWTLFAFKVVTLAATFWAAAGSMDAAIILMATNWFWIAIPMFAIWGPLFFHYRKRKVRRRRNAMVRAEWMLD